MKEIEVKIKTESFDKILENLNSKHIEMSDPIRQEDRIFALRDITYPTKVGDYFLRIRNQNGKYTLNMKQQVGNELDNLEYETDIDSPDQVEGILRVLGLVLVMEVKKTRCKAKYQDMEICLDEVEGLGKFVEIEKLATDADSPEVQKGLLKVLESLGLDPAKQIWQGYDTQLYLKKMRANK